MDQVTVSHFKKRKLRLLTFTTLFPNSVQPRHGIFVENRLRQLLASGMVDAHVVAPIPWFPSHAKMFGRYARYAQIDREEIRLGLSIYHPRYFVAPRIGMLLQPKSLAFSAARCIEKLLKIGVDFDVIDAHYFYPDGVAAAILSREFNRPFVVTARGSDINMIANLPGPRKMIVSAASAATHIIAVSQALRNKLINIGVDARKIIVLRNGVDASMFFPEPKDKARQALGLGSEWIVASVGNLAPEKRHHLVIEAIARMDNVYAVFVGDGPEKSRLELLTARLGMQQRIRFMPVVSQADLRSIYSAVDILVLASSREGWPNVVLESMACGTPVVVSDVGGVREIVADLKVGRIVEQPTPQSLASALRSLLQQGSDRSYVCNYAKAFSWESTTAGQLKVFAAACRIDAKP